jgi:hypothetical protein
VETILTFGGRAEISWSPLVATPSSPEAHSGSGGRILRYECLTDDPSLVSAVFVPFYTSFVMAGAFLSGFHLGSPATKEFTSPWSGVLSLSRSNLIICSDW